MALACYIRLAALASDTEREQLCWQAAELYSPLPPAALEPVLGRLLRLPPLADLARYDGSFAAQGYAKRATSELTGRFVSAAVTATREKFGPGPIGRYSAELVVPEEFAAECGLLKAIAYRYVMRRPAADAQLAVQRRLVSELVAALAERGEPALSLVLRESWRSAGSDAERLRVVIDQVAQLTDSAARAWHARYVGPTPRSNSNG